MGGLLDAEKFVYLLLIICNSPRAKRAKEAQRKGVSNEKCIKDDELVVWPLLLYLSVQKHFELARDLCVLLLLSMDQKFASSEFSSVVTALGVIWDAQGLVALRDCATHS